MKNRALTFLLSLFLLSSLVFAQQRSIMHKAPSILDKPSTVLEKSFTPGYSPLTGNYKGVDTMTNSLSFAETGESNLCFDPYSGTLALVHRGWSGHYAAGSGQIWYNISTDFGTTWKRVPGGLNTSLPVLQGRYPNMAISNPTKGDISKTTGLFVWPELAVGEMGFAADQPLGNGQPAAFIDSASSNYNTQMMAWADDKSPEVFWTANFQSAENSARLKLFKTSDFATIDTLSPPQWQDSVFSSNGNIGIGGCSYNGVQYVGVIAPFDTNLVPNPPTGGWLVGYSKSTDKGATWSTFNVADFRNVPKLANYDELFDYKKGDTYVSYQGSIGVDKNNHVHIIVGVTDSTTNRDLGTNSIVDIFETGSGWNGTVVYKGLDTAYSNGPGFGQLGPAAELAFDSSHSVMAVQFINTITPGVGKKNDLFLTYKGINDTSWATPINLTSQADSVNNTEAHMAPMLYKVGNQYTAFSGFGYSPFPITAGYDGNQATVLYVGTHSFNYTPTGVNDPVAAVNNFRLLQNYPNPFNPSTTINYSLPQKNNVSLKVYDVLGREVANLVNTTQEAGNHSINFNASKLASGLYIYTLRSGNNSVSKKMMLMK
jgi:hypothetical protein